jgi:hypothetical protein
VDRQPPGTTAATQEATLSTLAELIDKEVRRLVDEAYVRASDVIVEQRAVLERIAHALLRWETLQGAELERAFVGEVANAEPVQAPGNRVERSRYSSMSPRLLPAAAMSLQPDVQETLR